MHFQQKTEKSQEEVSTLMALFQSYLDDYSKRADSENIKSKIIGNRKGLSAKMIWHRKCMEATKTILELYLI